MVKSLIELGLVVKMRAPHDARERIVQITEKGRRVFAEAMRGTVKTRAPEFAALVAVGGFSRSYDEARERMGVLDDLLCTVRFTLRDRARLLYAVNPFAAGWVPPRARVIYEMADE